MADVFALLTQYSAQVIRIVGGNTSIGVRLLSFILSFIFLSILSLPSFPHSLRVCLLSFILPLNFVIRH